MSHYSEDDTASDTSYEDSRSTGPLLPSRCQSWSPVKESFLPPKQPKRFLWRPRFQLPVRRRYGLVAVLFLITFGSISLLMSSRLSSHLDRITAWSSSNAPHIPPDSTSVSPSAPEDEPEITEDSLPIHLRPDTVLEGWEATAHFRDSLRNDTGYMTSFLSAGFTNDQMTIGNLIYLSLITGRVPILPPFTSYIEGGASPLPFSQVFDIPRMVLAINAPVLEWQMVKDLDRAQSENAYDEIGCWNIMEVDDMRSNGPRGSYSTVLLNLDISYTRAPKAVKLIPDYEHDSHSTFWALAKLAFPQGRAQALADPDENPTRPSPRSRITLLPDEQLVCYDYMYYLCALEPFEYEQDYSPMWREVMVHAHWNRETVHLARSYLRQTFNLPSTARIPPFIAIHVRHGDFAGWCGDVPLSECFAPLSAYAQRVREVQDELRERHGLYVNHVIMTGDEKDPLWWEGVQERGWSRIDHKGLRTAEDWGNWYPVVLDAVVQSMAVGFVGTDRSTFSHMARRRVADWNKGVTRMVKWGHVGADDH